MSTLLDLHGRNAQLFTDLVDLITDEWDAPTPCEQWSVHDLVNHMTSEQLWVPDMLTGRTIAEVGDRFDGDVLGADPQGHWHVAMNASRAAWLEPGSLERVVHLSFGDAPSELYMTQMLTDLAIHGWDLATALSWAGLDIAPSVDEETAVYLLPSVEASSDPQGSTYFKAPTTPSDDASIPEKLICLTGRVWNAPAPA